MKKLVVILLAVLAGTAQGSVPSDRHKPETDMALLQRLSEMETNAVVRELDGMQPEPYIGYVMALGRIWSDKRNPRLAALYFDMALAKARQEKLPTEEARVLFLYALFEDKNGRLASALERITAATALAEGRDPEFLKQCLSLKGNMEHRRGNLPDSIATHERLLKLATGEYDDLLRANSLQEIAMLSYKTGHMEKCEEQARAAMAVFEKKGDDRGVADGLKLLGNLASDRKQSEAALGFYGKAVERYRAAHNVHGEANCQFNVGILYRSAKQYNKAIASLQDAVASYTGSSSVTGVGIANMELGNVYLDMGETAKAESALTLAVGLLTKSGDLVRLAQAHVSLGRLRNAQGNAKDAAEHYRDAADCYRKAGMKDEADRALGMIRSDGK